MIRQILLRVVLREKTGCNTFPQIFINGEFIGGCTELFELCKDGKLIEKLAQLDSLRWLGRYRSLLPVARLVAPKVKATSTPSI